jgi:hypothetical protein
LALCGKLESFESFSNPRVHLLYREAEIARAERHIFFNSLPHKLMLGFLENHADQGACASLHASHWFAVEENLTGGGSEKSVQVADEHRLAGPAPSRKQYEGARIE